MAILATNYQKVCASKATLLKRILKVFQIICHLIGCYHSMAGCRLVNPVVKGPCTWAGTKYSIEVNKRPHFVSKLLALPPSQVVASRRLYLDIS
jgi:hypothetical protein